MRNPCIGALFEAMQHIEEIRTKKLPIGKKVPNPLTLDLQGFIGEKDLIVWFYEIDSLSSTIKLSKNPVLHGRSKHIDVRFHFLRDLTRDGKVKLVYCGSKDQLADIMTKPLKLEEFVKQRELLGVCEVPNLN